MSMRVRSFSNGFLGLDKTSLLQKLTRSLSQLKKKYLCLKSIGIC